MIKIYAQIKEIKEYLIMCLEWLSLRLELRVTFYNIYYLVLYNFSTLGRIKLSLKKKNHGDRNDKHRYNTGMIGVSALISTNSTEPRLRSHWVGNFRRQEYGGSFLPKTAWPLALPHGTQLQSGLHPCMFLSPRLSRSLQPSIP